MLSKREEFYSNIVLYGIMLSYTSQTLSLCNNALLCFSYYTLGKFQAKECRQAMLVTLGLLNRSVEEQKLLEYYT